MFVPDYDLLFEGFVRHLPELAGVAKAAAFPAVLLSLVPFLVWLERRGSAFMQDRLGPNRASILGFRMIGMLHLIADTIKFFTKETFVPANAHKFFYYFAPALVSVSALLAYCAIPVSSPFLLFDRVITMQIAPVESGALFVLAVSSVSAFAIMLGGYAACNKYALFGSMRALAQVVSYEVPLALSILGAVMVYGTLDLNEMVRYQEGLLFGFLPRWGILLQPLGFVLLLVSAFAECNRLPFDMPEGEPEIVAGYHTEYGGIKFSMFMMSEYVAMMTASSLITTIYLGGYSIPWVDSVALAARIGSIPASLLHLAAFSAKTGFFLWLFIWVRWTLPRFRYDQVMTLGWKRLVPLGLANALVTAGALAALALVGEIL